ncbi:hypothetical protein EXIGLDRAFT_61140 [Exidia glandulosa HHB12029]|uniref:Uncharacterized protein n=1 Tax=Exidia glandulosa HHB12029 TaxID=1314781 RepID=A0A165I3T4_EXIGL|nr:hypothetical protein EXIGLDRAFT_61140 [Exidia glandulosa HHB12029]
MATQYPEFYKVVIHEHRMDKSVPTRARGFGADMRDATVQGLESWARPRRTTARVFATARHATPIHLYTCPGNVQYSSRCYSCDAPVTNNDFPHLIRPSWLGLGTPRCWASVHKSTKFKTVLSRTSRHSRRKRDLTFSGYHHVSQRSTLNIATGIRYTSSWHRGAAVVDATGHLLALYIQSGRSWAQFSHLGHDHTSRLSADFSRLVLPRSTGPLTTQKSVTPPLELGPAPIPSLLLSRAGFTP